MSLIPLSDTSGKIQRRLKELDIKVTSVSGIVTETRMLVMDAAKGM
jgi:hypothetical protein